MFTTPRSRRSALKRIGRLMLGAYGLAGLTIGCRPQRLQIVDDFPVPKVPNFHALVSVRWVKKLLDYQRQPDPSARPATYSNERFAIVEASWGPLDEAGDYHRGHLPGAIHFDTDELENGYPRWQLRPLPELQQTMGRRGIAPDTTVIVYGRQLIAAARVWWAMKYAGVADVRLLDGNVDTWTAAGYQAEQTVNTLPIVAFAAPGKAEWLATTEWVKTVLESDRVWLADVRSDDEYAGRVSGYDYLDAKGRIPGAIPLGDGDDSASRYRQADGRLRPPAEVLAEWRKRGLRLDATGRRFERDVVFYCGGGWRSSVAFYYAWLLGIDNIRNYSDGWCGWSTTYEQDPKAAGSTPGWQQRLTGNPIEVGTRQ